MKDDTERLHDILEAIERIERYATRGRNAFENDELIQNWIVHHLQIIGEATAQLSAALRERYSETPWRDIIGMRNVLVHDYFGVDTNIVWKVVENELPSLRDEIERILTELAD